MDKLHFCYNSTSYFQSHNSKFFVSNTDLSSAKSLFSAWLVRTSVNQMEILPVVHRE